MAATQKRARNTKQLATVWQVVKDDKSHPSANQVYDRVRRQLPNISLGTKDTKSTKFGDLVIRTLRVLRGE